MSRTVMLTLDEVRVCAQIGTERWIVNAKSTNRPNYAGEHRKALEPELSASVRSIVAEYAVAKLYEVPWVMPWYPVDEHHFRRHFPDVMPCYEVKTVRTRDCVPVFEKDIAKGGILIATKVTDVDYYQTIEVYGWLDVQDCVHPDWYDDTDTSFRVPVMAFRDTIPGVTTVTVMEAS